MCDCNRLVSGGHACRFALQERVFPVLHLGTEYWPDKFEPSTAREILGFDWRLDPWAMEALHKKLIAAERNESSTFYEFEGSLGLSPFTTSVTRDGLMDAFKYFFKSGVPPAAFWQRFCRRGEAPMEALDIILDAEQVARGGRYGMH